MKISGGIGGDWGGGQRRGGIGGGGVDNCTVVGGQMASGGSSCQKWISHLISLDYEYVITQFLRMHKNFYQWPDLVLATPIDLFEENTTFSRNVVETLYLYPNDRN